MRILVDGRVIQDHFPGIARYAFNILRAMLSLPKSPEIALLYNPQALNTRHPLDELAECSQLELLPCKVPLFSLRNQWSVVRQIASVELDLVHFFYYIHPYWLNLPTVCTLYDLIPSHFPEMFSLAERAIFRTATWLAAHKSDHLICTSRATQQDVLKSYRIPATRTSVVGGATAATFRPQPFDAQQALRRERDLPHQFLLYVGSNKPHKNLSRLIQAWAQVALEHPDTSLVIAGHWDPHFPQPQREAALHNVLDQTRFLGPIPETALPVLYSAAVAFVFPSLCEGFGLPVLEAMACGTPVLTSARGSLAEVVGDTALTIDPYDVPAMAKSIRCLLNEPSLREELSRRGRERAKRFSWKRSAEKVLTLYQHILQDD